MLFNWSKRPKDATINLIRSAVSDCSVEKAEAIRLILIEQDCAIWHASWLYHSEQGKTKYPCQCVPCVKARKAH